MPHNGVKAKRKPIAGDTLARMEAQRIVNGRKGLDRALLKLGGGAALGRVVGKSRQAISRWEMIPEEYLLQIEHATGLTLKDLRPDLVRR